MDNPKRKLRSGKEVLKDKGQSKEKPNDTGSGDASSAHKASEDSGHAVEESEREDRSEEHGSPQTSEALVCSLCNFVAKTQTALKIHSTRKHSHKGGVPNDTGLSSSQNTPRVQESDACAPLSEEDTQTESEHTHKADGRASPTQILLEIVEPISCGSVKDEEDTNQTCTDGPDTQAGCSLDSDTKVKSNKNGGIDGHSKPNTCVEEFTDAHSAEKHIKRQRNSKSDHEKHKRKMLENQDSLETEKTEGRSQTQESRTEGRSHHQCGRCDFTANSSVMLAQHIKTAHPPEHRFHCRLCHYYTSTTEAMQSHLCEEAHLQLADQNHTSALFEDCVEKILVILSDQREPEDQEEEQLRKDSPHKRKRGRPKTSSETVCRHCGLVASNATNLSVHIRRRHSRLYSFVCKLCSYYCVTKGDMDRHCETKKHLNKMQAAGGDDSGVVLLDSEQPAQAKTTELAHTVAEIEMTIEDDDVDEASVPRKRSKPDLGNVCAQCGFPAHSATSLALHVRRKHTKDFEFVCLACSYYTVTRREMFRHMATEKHKQKRESYLKRPKRSSKPETVGGSEEDTTEDAEPSIETPEDQDGEKQSAVKNTAKDKEEYPTDPTEESPTNPMEESPTDPMEESPTDPTEESPINPTVESPTDPTEESPINPTVESPTNPMEESPTDPMEESPTDPTEESPINPTEESPTDPTEESPTDPTEESPTDPTEESPTDPTEESPTNPMEESPTDPTEESPTDPTEESPTNPMEESPTDPTVESPTDPTEESPINPTEESPTDPTEESPTDPTEESPTDPTVESPTDPTEESPTDPTEESPTDPTEESPTNPTEESPIDPTKSNETQSKTIEKDSMLEDMDEENMFYEDETADLGDDSEKHLRGAQFDACIFPLKTLTEHKIPHDGKQTTGASVRKPKTPETKPAKPTPRIRCEDCGFLADGLSGLNVHISMKHPSKEKHFHCLLCGKSFYSESNLQQHLSSAAHLRNEHGSVEDLPDGGASFRCVRCSEPCHTEQDLFLHIKEKHEELLREVNKYVVEDTEQINRERQENQGSVCKYCGKVCKSSNSMAFLAHIRTHTGSKPFMCKICNFATAQLGDARNHVKRHLGMREYKCHICGWAFVMKKHLNTHLLGKHGLGQPKERKFECDLCERNFSEKWALNNHMKLHTGDKPFKCGWPSCHYAFLTLSAMKDHHRTHTGEKSFLCDLCGFAGGTRHALTKHRRQHTGERPFKCQLCSFASTTQSHLTRHKRVHTGEKPYRCPWCDYRSNCAENIRKHILHTGKHEGVKMYNCPKCSYATNGPMDFRNHLKETHPDLENPDLAYLHAGIVSKSFECRLKGQGASFVQAEAAFAPDEPELGSEALQQVIIIQGYGGGEVAIDQALEESAAATLQTLAMSSQLAEVLHLTEDGQLIASRDQTRYVLVESSGEARGQEEAERGVCESSSALDALLCAVTEMGQQGGATEITSDQKSDAQTPLAQVYEETPDQVMGSANQHTSEQMQEVLQFAASQLMMKEGLTQVIVNDEGTHYIVTQLDDSTLHVEEPSGEETVVYSEVSQE
ncbi:zinc finger protein 407 [Rhinichthys klamathensis goyatoka]|uniref:zinc finger protein 407 n=1 Tax=Rhinichthys klamathensis goyatoka TaxID=3034132 RepID=UPI0024B55A71|nr:zinc finger protein 407 [Rhinichthys klamathensis goyatoka]